MARETLIKLTDDLDGTEAVESVTFALRGTEWELDLSPKNVAALEKALGKYMDAGRRVGRPKAKRAPRARAKVTQGSVPEIRAWAAANGYTVSSRGRIPGEIREAFEAAHG
jgi:hypothetical protein